MKKEFNLKFKNKCEEYVEWMIYRIYVNLKEYTKQSLTKRKICWKEKKIRLTQQ